MVAHASIARHGGYLQNHRLILRVAFAGANVFAWILAFQYFYVLTSNIRYAFVDVVLLYTLSHDVTLLLTPFAARGVRSSVKRLMVLGTLCAAGAFVFLGASFAGFFGRDLYWGVLGFSMLLALYRALYWVPYEIEAHTHPSLREKGTMWREMLVALVPMLGGLLLAGGYQAVRWLLFGAAALLLSSLVPLSKLGDVYENFSWSYAETFRQLFTFANRRMVGISILNGMQGAALLLMWPIAVFLIVNWSYGMLGIVLAVTFLLALLARRLYRSFILHAHLEQSRIIPAAVGISGWLMRLSVASPFGVALVDTFFYTATPARSIGVDQLVFEQSADGGSYVDEYTALKEISLALGRIFICLFAAVLALAYSLPMTLAIVFILAALATGWSVYLSREAMR